MHVYTIIITLLVIGSLFFDLKNNRGNIYFVGVLIFIGVITGLRSENVGHDTANYISIYDAVTCLPFKQIFTTAPYNALEPGYLAFCWISGAIGLSSDSFILLT